MAKNPLEQLLKRDPRENPTLGLDPETIQPYTQRAGAYNVNVQKPATNKTLQFLDQFQKGLQATNVLVDETQRVATQRVAEMSDEEFDKAYNELIGGDKKVLNIFGYNKAFQEKMVEETYKRVVPDEVLELKQNFERRIHQFNDINEYNDAVDKTVEDYYADLGKRFNNNPFAQSAHNILQQKTKSKLKTQLNSSYLESAKQYIESSSQTDLVDVFNYFGGDLDSEALKANVNTYHGKAADNLNGDMLAASKMTRAALKQHIEGKIATGQIDDIEDAEDLFHVIFNDAEPFKVGGKEIFETLEGQQLERDLRRSLHNARITAPQITEAKVKRTVADFVVGILDATGEDKRKKIEESRTAINQIEDSQERVMTLELFNKSLDGDLIDEETVYQELVRDVTKVTPDKTNFGSNEVLSIIDEAGLTESQQGVFYEYTQGGSGTTRVPTAVFNNLETLHRTLYAQELRKIQKPIITNSTLSPDQKYTQVEEARLQAKEIADTKLTKHIRELVDAEQPVIQSNELIVQARRLGVSERKIKQAEALARKDPNKSKAFLEPLIENVTSGVREETTIKIGNRNELSIGRFDDAVDVVDNYTKAVIGGAFADNEQRRAFHKAHRFVAKDKRAWGNLAEQYDDGQRQSALEQMYELYGVRGFTLEEIEQGYVEHSYNETIVTGSLGSPQGVAIPRTETRKRSVKIPLDHIMMQNVDEYGNIDLNGWDKVPIRFNTENLPYVNADFKRASKALGIPESRLRSQQRSYFDAVGLTDSFDYFSDPEKKSNEVDDVLPTVSGDEPDLDVEGSDVDIFKERYNISEGQTINYREFAKQFYNEFTDIPPEEINAGLDAKFKAMENRDPRLLETVSKPVKISLNIEPKAQKQFGSSPYGYYDPKTHTIHLNPKLNADEMAQVLMHELVHSAQFKNTRLPRAGINIYTDELKLNRRRVVNPKESFTEYLKSEPEAEARIAEVGRAFSQLTGTFIKPNDTKTAMEALVWFMGTDLSSQLSPRLSSSYSTTSDQLFRILDLKPEDYSNKEEQGAPLDKEKLRKDLEAIPNINLILKSVSTLASKDKPLNPKQQLA